MNFPAVILISVALVTGCSHELNLQLPAGEPLRLSIHAHGSPLATCSLVPGSPKYHILEKWLSKNRKGWQITPATYVPRTVISGPGFTINFIESLAIVNYAEGQYSHAITSLDYEFLQCK